MLYCNQCDVDSRLNLTRLQHMSNLEILQLMMREVIYVYNPKQV